MMDICTLALDPEKAASFFGVKNVNVNAPMYFKMEYLTFSRQRKINKTNLFLMYEDWFGTSYKIPLDKRVYPFSLNTIIPFIKLTNSCYQNFIFLSQRSEVHKTVTLFKDLSTQFPPTPHHPMWQPYLKPVLDTEEAYVYALKKVKDVPEHLRDELSRFQIAGSLGLNNHFVPKDSVLGFYLRCGKTETLFDDILNWVYGQGPNAELWNQYFGWAQYEFLFVKELFKYLKGDLHSLITMTDDRRYELYRELTNDPSHAYNDYVIAYVILYGHSDQELKDYTFEHDLFPLLGESVTQIKTAQSSVDTLEEYLKILKGKHE